MAEGADDALAREAGRAVFGQGFELAERYAELLCQQGIEWGLLGPREADRIWSRHLLNSASLAPFLSAGAEVVDVGSGAGLPGVPLAIARPDVSVVLLEPLLRRTRFLELVVSELGLGARVRVLRGRAEDVAGSGGRGKSGVGRGPEEGSGTGLLADVVVCRAVAPLDRLARWCVPLMSRDGQLLALKGDGAVEEVARTTDALVGLGVRAEVLEVEAAPGERAVVVRVRRV